MSGQFRCFSDATMRQVGRGFKPPTQTGTQTCRPIAPLSISNAVLTGLDPKSAIVGHPNPPCASAGRIFKGSFDRQPVFRDGEDFGLVVSRKTEDRTGRNNRILHIALRFSTEVHHSSLHGRAADAHLGI